MSTIPVSQIVQINPAVVSAGGNPLSLNSVFITTNAIAPIGIQSFPSADDVAVYYGTESEEAKLAINYFLGFDNSSRKPGTLYITGTAQSARAAWIRGQALSGMTLSQLQSISGSLSVTIDGTVKSAASVNLSSASSFTNAATMISTALSLSGGQAVTWDSDSSKFVITSGTAGATSTITFASGTAADPLGLSSGTLSQGAAIETPNTVMNRVKESTQDWGAFMTIYEPSGVGKEGFATWSNAQNNRFVYVAWDSAAGNLVANNAAMFGSIVASLKYEGTFVVYNTAALAAFVCGYIGSINFQELNGRATPAFKSQSGLVPTADTLANATALLSNNVSYYGAYQAPGQGNLYNILYDGRMNGSKFRWLDTYVNQIYLNAQLQLAMFVGLTQVNSSPYNSDGYGLIRAWCADPIAEALNNGTIRIGVPLSASQKAAITMQVGIDVSTQLETQGYYLQILPATAQVRGQRQSPPIRLYYADGGSIQQISMASIAVL